MDKNEEYTKNFYNYIQDLVEINNDLTSIDIDEFAPLLDFLILKKDEVEHNHFINQLLIEIHYFHKASHEFIEKLEDSKTYAEFDCDLNPERIKILIEQFSYTFWGELHIQTQEMLKAIVSLLYLRSPRPASNLFRSLIEQILTSSLLLILFPLHSDFNLKDQQNQIGYDQVISYIYGQEKFLKFSKNDIKDAMTKIYLKYGKYNAQDLHKWKGKESITRKTIGLICINWLMEDLLEIFQIHICSNCDYDIYPNSNYSPLIYCEHENNKDNDIPLCDVCELSPHTGLIFQKPTISGIFFIFGCISSILSPKLSKITKNALRKIRISYDKISKYFIHYSTISVEKDFLKDFYEPEGQKSSIFTISDIVNTFKDLKDFVTDFVFIIYIYRIEKLICEYREVG